MPVVLLHALGSDSGTWDAFAARLTRRVLAVDLRGHGDSVHTEKYSLEAMADDVAELLDELGIQQADLVGHSLGGRVAVLLAQRLPGRVRRLVVEDAPPPPAEAGEPLAPTREPAEPLPFDWRLIDPIMAELRTPDPGWWERLAVIGAPTLLVGGGPSSHVTRESLERMSGLIADCRLVTVEDAGHRVHGAKPEEFGALVEEFLDGA